MDPSGNSSDQQRYRVGDNGPVVHHLLQDVPGPGNRIVRSTLHTLMGAASIARTAVASAAVWCMLAGCAGDTPDGTAPSTSVPSPTAVPTSFAVAGCPVSDAAFCQRATAAATALATGDVNELLALASQETFACDQMPAGMVNNCRPGVVLSGHGTFAVATKITAVAPADYRRQLASMFERVDPAYRDERGLGGVAILGVGTCGPEDPQQRSYHLAFNLALRDEKGGPTERWLGSLEFVFRNSVWTFPLMYLDTVRAWRAEHADPFQDTACGNVRAWRVGNG
jgi:hypothetical protein